MTTSSKNGFQLSSTFKKKGRFHKSHAVVKVGIPYIFFLIYANIICIHTSMLSNPPGLPIQPPRTFQHSGFLGFPGHRVDGLDAGASWPRAGVWSREVFGFNNLFR